MTDTPKIPESGDNFIRPGGIIVTHDAPSISLRDWFAGQAMISVYDGGAAWPSTLEAAQWCYEMADAMLKAREGDND